MRSRPFTIISEDGFPVYPRVCVASLPRDARPFNAAIKVVLHASGDLRSGVDARFFREAVQRCCLDIEVGRAELAYEEEVRHGVVA